MKIKFLDNNEYIYDITKVNNTFILFSNYFHHKTYKITITDFKSYTKSIELEDRENVIIGYHSIFFQKLAENTIFIKSISNETITFLKSENIEVLYPPDLFQTLIENKNATSLFPFNSDKYILSEIWFYKNTFITLQIKVQWKKIDKSGFKRNDKLKISVYSIDGKIIREIPFKYQGYDNYRFCENIFVGKVKNKIFIIDINNGNTLNYILENEQYNIQDINNQGDIILTNNRKLIIIKYSKNQILTIADKNFKGIIKFVRFDYLNNIIIFFSRKILVVKKENFEQIKDFDTEKIYLKRSLNISENRTLIYYHIYNKALKKYLPEIRIIET